MHPPREVSFLVVFVTIAGGDDYDDIDGGDAQHANDKGMQQLHALSLCDIRRVNQTVT